MTDTSAAIISILQNLRAYLITYQGADDDLQTEFWTYPNPDIIEDGFYELAERIRSNISAKDIQNLPRGFLIVYALFNWESERSSTGWICFHNFDKDFMEAVIAAYSFIGLDQESAAVRAAYKQWLSDSEDLEKTIQAYHAIDNKYQSDYDRIPYLIDFLQKYLAR